MNFLKKIIFIAFSSIILSLILSFEVSAERYSVDGYEIPVDVVVNGHILRTPEKAFLEHDTVFVPLRAVAEATGATVNWNGETDIATVELGDDMVEFSENTSEDAAVMHEETMFVPVRDLAESLGYTVTWDDYYFQVWISAPDVFIEEEHRNHVYTNNDILLLAKVLQSECGSSPFEAKIAVANVVCNRVESDLFPDSVSEVIYDRRGGSIQFSIAYNGVLEKTEPSDECILAAKCALNGVVVAKDCLFFQADYVENSWMNNNREYAMSLGGNAFFY